MESQYTSANAKRHRPITPSPRVVAAVDNVLGEGPLWCADEQALWWLDAGQPTLLRWDLCVDAVRSWPLPKLPASLARLEDGGLLIIFRSRFAVLPAPDAALRWLDAP